MPAAPDSASQGSAAADRASPVLSRLGAGDGPAGEHAEQLMLFGQFVGSWDVDLTDFGHDGSRRRRRGEWHFDWVLGGVAVQDILFEHGAPAQDRGTTLRAYDPTIDAWRVTWMSPGGGEFANLVARPSGDEIVLEGSDSAGRDVRWSFCQITPETFVWRGEASSDGGRTWWLEQEMRARRVAARPGC